MCVSLCNEIIFYTHKQFTFTPTNNTSATLCYIVTFVQVGYSTLSKFSMNDTYILTEHPQLTLGYHIQRPRTMLQG